MNNGYDENGQVLKFSIQEIEEAKKRVKLKRSIRKKSFRLIPLKNMTTFCVFISVVEKTQNQVSDYN